MTERYVELHAASAFSFLEGASQPEKLVERAVELEMPAMALLDRNGVYGSARFHTSAKRNNVRAHVGAEIAVSSFGSRLVPPAWLPHRHSPEPSRVSLLCESRQVAPITLDCVLVQLFCGERVLIKPTIEMPDQPKLNPAVDPRIAVSCQPSCEQIDVPRQRALP
jgi:hypothetical protein